MTHLETRAVSRQYRIRQRYTDWQQDFGEKEVFTKATSPASESSDSWEDCYSEVYYLNKCPQSDQAAERNDVPISTRASAEAKEYSCNN